ncbi:MAG: TolC family protein [Rubripirellula sp.]
MKSLSIASQLVITFAVSGCATIGPPASPPVAPATPGKNAVATQQASGNGGVSLVGYNTDANATTYPDTTVSSSDIEIDTMELEPVVIPADESETTILPPPNQPAVPIAAEAQFGSSYTLAEIEQAAISNNPALSVASATLSKSAGLRSQVGVRPNPTLGYFGQQIAARNTDQHGLFIEQEFVRGNKLALNREVLAHTTSAQRNEIETQRYRVLTDVRVRFFETLAAQKQLDATLEFAKLAERGVEVAIERQNAEEGTLIEVLQSKTLLSEVTLASEQLAITYRAAWQDLAAIAGLSSLAPSRLVAELDMQSDSPSWEAAYGEIIATSPELAVANALVCEKSALLKRQKVQMVPNVTAQLGAGYDNGTDSGMINLQVSAPIPVWNKNSGNISAAYADYTRAIENVKRIEQSIKSRLARVAQEYDASIATVQKYDQEIIPQAKKSLELSEEAYRAGELDFLQVLIVRRSYYESSIRLIAARGKLAQASANVDGLLLTGGLDAPADYTDGDGIRGASFGGQ